MSLRDLLKPREVRWTLRELDKCIGTAPSNLYDIRNTVAQRCKQLIRYSDKTCYSIRVDGHTPETLALLISTHVTETLLCSGQFHSYRGILSGEGRGLKGLLDHLYDLQLKAGVLSDEGLNEAKSSVEEEIRSVG